MCSAFCCFSCGKLRIENKWIQRVTELRTANGRENKSIETKHKINQKTIHKMMEWQKRI